MKQILTIFFYAIFLHSGTTQTVLSSSDFLKNAQSETAISYQQQKVDLLQNGTYKIPVIDKLEFRTQTDENEWKQQEYRVRMSPSGLKERKEYQNFHQSEIDFAATEERGILQDVLINRYNLLVDWQDLRQSLTLLRQQELVIEDRIMVFKRQALTVDFDIANLIDAEDVLHKIQQDILKKELEEKRTENFVKRDLNLTADVQLDRTNWVTFSNLKTAVADLKIPISTHPNLVQRQSKIALINAEEQLEIARNQQWFDFVETRYKNDDKNPVENEFSIGVGIRIPFKNQMQLDLNELALDRLEEQNSLNLKTVKLTDNIEEIQERLTLLFQQHDQITEQMQESQALFSLDQFTKTGNVNPLTLLKIQENLLKRQASLQKLEAQAFEYYIDLLDWTGRVVALPLRNYLQRDFAEF
jgi:hypothetical protein